MEAVRLDRWLCAARIFKSRTRAAQGCAGGRVAVNGSRAKPHYPVHVGDRIEVRREERLVVLEVRGLREKRVSPALARELYEDQSPPPPPREEPVGRRPRGSGRPTKRDRRLLRRLRGT